MPIGRMPMQYTPTIQAGRLRHKIDLAQITSVQDSMGGSDQSLNVVYANVWAYIDALSGTEKFAAHEFVSQVSHRVIIRYMGASPSWQPGQAVQLGQLCIDSNGNWQQAQGNGITGTQAPTWAQIADEDTADGFGSTAFTWYNLGAPPPQTGVNAGMVVLFQNRVFQVESVLNPDERSKMLVLLCIEINDSRWNTASYPGDLD